MRVNHSTRRYLKPTASMDISTTGNRETTLAYLDMYEDELAPSEIDFKRGWPDGKAARLIADFWAQDKAAHQSKQLRADDPDRLPSVMSLAPFERERILQAHEQRSATLQELAEEYGVDLVSLKNFVARKKRADADAV